jgi:hypothetical protein
MFWQATERWEREQATVLVQFETLPPPYQRRTCVIVKVEKPTVVFRDVTNEEEFPIDFTDADIRLQSFEKIDQTEIVCVFRAMWEEDVDFVPACAPVIGTFVELRKPGKPS